MTRSEDRADGMKHSTVPLTEGEYAVFGTVPNAMRSRELLEHLNLEVQAMIRDRKVGGGNRASLACQYLGGVLGID